MASVKGVCTCIAMCFRSANGLGSIVTIVTIALVLWVAQEIGQIAVIGNVSWPNVATFALHTKGIRSWCRTKKARDIEIATLTCQFATVWPVAFATESAGTEYSERKVLGGTPKVVTLALLVNRRCSCPVNIGAAADGTINEMAFGNSSARSWLAFTDGGGDAMKASP